MSARSLRRRDLLKGASAGLALAAWPLRGFSEAAPAPRLEPDRATREALGSSPLVYISPLRSDGSESRCHGEVWFFEDAGDVVIGTDPGRWKGRAVAAGLDRARIWVGDFGRVTRAGERFREAPTFVAKASLDPDPATFGRLLARFATKYADEWGKWGPRFERSYADGSRVLIRYRPVAP